MTKEGGGRGPSRVGDCRNQRKRGREQVPYLGNSAEGGAPEEVGDRVRGWRWGGNPQAVVSLSAAGKRK